MDNFNEMTINRIKSLEDRLEMLEKQLSVNSVNDERIKAQFAKEEEITLFDKIASK